MRLEREGRGVKKVSGGYDLAPLTNKLDMFPRGPCGASYFIHLP